MKVRVKGSPIHGLGVFASEDLSGGSAVGIFEGKEVKQDTRHSLTLCGRKIEPSSELRYLNHSKFPNCGFVGTFLIARHSIKEGEELTIDYRKTEENITHTFEGLN